MIFGDRTLFCKRDYHKKMIRFSPHLAQFSISLSRAGRMPTPQQESLFVEQGGKPVLEHGARCQLPSHSSSQRQQQEKCAAGTQFAAGAEAAAVCPGDGLGDRQSQSRTAGIARSIAVDSVESIEYSL